MTDESLSDSLSDGQMTDSLTYWAIHHVTNDTTTDWSTGSVLQQSIRHYRTFLLVSDIYCTIRQLGHLQHLTWYIL